MALPIEKEQLTESLTRRSGKLQAQLADSISAIPLQFEAVCADESVLFSLMPDPWMRNPGNVVHGGILCTVLDIAMGIVVAGCLHRMAPTVDMHTEFIRPVRLDAKIHIRVHASSIGKTLAYMRATLWQDEETQPCASVSGIYFTKA